ncbi:cis-aconitate porin Opd [Halopseudomonas oceani]|uniref:Outer membrane porin, OprD family n=1 Tax=Halopseudomonas oceani TaxID=1708783 RepID=A0A2P4EQD8_9GAMM|nr:OprD family porin [Halopseudomonas oceani]POB00825.1 outer membrane porin, OprD family [Halopseudomonas oceani]GGE59323.1 cis-aconitate porin Opd [Halopseudomonas oceani]
MHTVFIPRRSLSAALLAASGLLLTPLAQASGFSEDSSAKLSTSNIYFNRDFREGTGQSKRDEWGQGFILDLKSGYTDGPVGFGLDAKAMLGIKLDSSPDRTGTGLLPTHDDGRAADEYSKLGLTAKARYSESELLLGTLMPKLPILQPNTSRILPQTFRGGMVNINEFDNFRIDLGRLTRATDRDSTDAEDLALNNKNRRFGGSFSADHLDWAGLNYQFNSGLAASYYLAQLDDIYRQHFFGLNHSATLGAGELSTELRVAVSDEQGSARAGRIDNQAWQGRIGYALNGHEVSAAAQKMRGDSAFPYIDGSNPYLVNFVQINDFAEANERSWQLRYDYDFATVGIPGLSFMTRYISGDDAKPAAGGTGSEWERNTELQYVFQDGALKNLGLRWRNASYRSDFARDADENRLIVSYAFPIW